VTAPYGALAKVYDRWTMTNDYARWADFILGRLPAPSGDDVRLLDVCCGTGTMTRLLGDHGYPVTGVDGSAAMLALARSAAPAATLRQAVLPGDRLADPASYAAAVCTFDSVNYLVEPGAVRGAFTRIAQALRPGGVFIFDVNTEHKLRTVFADSHYGDDLDDFAYVWRNRTDPATRTTEFLITLFTRQPTGFVRETERHVQRWFDHRDLVADASAAGFTVESRTDDYTDKPVHDRTMRETWVLRREP
jgi:SAM-dependent methyltransferase